MGRGSYEAVMNTLYLYNPENDIALGHDPKARFTAPRAAERLARYGAPVLWWVAEAGDAVYVPEPESEIYAEELALWRMEMERRFGPGAEIVHTLNVDKMAEPWGWSAHTARILAEGGAEVPELIADNLGRIRDISHRHTSVEINRQIREELGEKWGSRLQAAGGREVRDARELERVLGTMGCGVFVKSPWSSSGRGVADCRRLSDDKTRERCLAIIARQGSVLVEPAYEKIQGFAMLFRSDGAGRVESVGLSVFMTERRASYSGNLVASDETLRARLVTLLPEELLRDVNRALERILTEITDSCYRGYMGVDMMAVATERGEAAIVPCVELNLRMTMGVVAHSLYRRLAGSGKAPSGPGLMKMIPGKRPAATPEGLPLVPYNDFFNIVLEEGAL